MTGTGLGPGSLNGRPTTLDTDRHAFLDRYPLLTRKELRDMPEPDPIIEQVLPGPRSLVALTGSRGLGKSLFALDMAGAISTNLPTWTGFDVRHHGTVMYMSREGFPSVPSRVDAWEAARRRTLDNVLWLPGPVDLRRPLHARSVGWLVREHGAVMVVVDSARATGAGKEDTGDMGEYVVGLETIRDISGALVLVLHNTGWDTTRERGSTLLPDACDTTLHLDGDPAGLRSLKHRKHRDGEMLTGPLWFRFRHVEGTASGIFDPTDSPGDDRTLRTLVLGFVASAPGIPTKGIVDELQRPRESVSRALSTLRGDGLIENAGTRQSPSWRLSGAVQV
jgi:AAA domain